MSRAKGTARPLRAESQVLLRRLQCALAVAKCIRIGAEYADNDVDLADAVAGLLLLLESATAMLDPQGGAS